MMSLNEMKLAVCGKLPELIYDSRSIYDSDKFVKCWVATGNDVNWPTEGLQVCHEATRLLATKGFRFEINNGGDTTWEVQGFNIKTTHEVCYVTGGNLFEAWLEAICRVWWPERFE